MVKHVNKGIVCEMSRYKVSRIYTDIQHSRKQPLVPFPPLLDQVHNAKVAIEIIGP